MSKRSKTKIESMEERRALILKTALTLFTDRGYFNTSVHDIQKEAKISIGSIYHYFKNKEAIAKALFDDLVGKFTQEISKIEDDYDTVQDRGLAIISYLFNLTEDSPEIMNYTLYARHREFMPGERPICSSRPFEIMRDIIEKGIESGEIRSMDPTVAVTSLFGGAIRMIHLRLDGVLNRSLLDYLEEVWECAWKSVAK